MGSKPKKKQDNHSQEMKEKEEIATWGIMKPSQFEPGSFKCVNARRAQKFPLVKSDQ